MSSLILLALDILATLARMPLCTVGFGNVAQPGMGWGTLERASHMYMNILAPLTLSLHVLCIGCRSQHVAVTLNVRDSTEVHVQPCVPPVQQPTCSRGVTAKSTDAGDDPDSSSTSCDSLLNTLADDVYSFTVKCAVQGVQGCRMFKAVMAMLFTFALQMGLLVLLWQAVVAGSATDVSKDMPETDRLWRQVGQVQRQVCWLNKNAVINTTAAAGGNLSCAGAWPVGPDCGFPSMDYVDLKHCLTALQHVSG